MLINKLITFTLFVYIVFLVSCSPEKEATVSESADEKKGTLSIDTTKKKKSPQSILALKRKIVDKRTNPVLSAALKNPHFNAKKWLKSDISFYKRVNPRRISEYDPIIKKMARRYGFDWRLIAAQIYAESNFKNESKSHVGALGLMQIMPGTAKFMGYDPKTMIKPKINIAVGCMYNQRMYNLWGKQKKDYNRLAFAIASYNAGRGRVLKSYSTGNNRTTWEKVYPLLPEETQSYVHKIYLKHDLYKKNIIP